ncbi:MAG: 23S rRNA (uracil(1939)-C(5))-methyltransferase RlmD [Syntrophomonadaceae bacterium]
MRCLIQGISHDGQGVGRIDGKVVFVPGALPGEDVELTIGEEKKNYLRGRLSSIIEPAPERVNPPCPYFGQCGGCHYQHASYDLQVDLKTLVVEQTLQRIGGVDADILPCVPAVSPWRYRNKVTWHGAMVDEHWKFGYYRGESNDIMDIDRCLLVSDAMQEAGRALGRALRKLNSREPVEAIVRESASGEIMTIVHGIDKEAGRKLRLQVDELTDSFYLFDRKGIECLQEGRAFEERIAGIRFGLSPLSFFQVNREQAEKLVGMVQESLELQGGEQVLDAYCGVGTLALSLAGRAKRLVGVESFPTAVEDARKNARLNGISNCRFLAGPAEQILPTLSQRFDAVVLDPPRAGCQPQVIKAVERMKIARVVYVSCEPSTLARDLGRFQQAGYRVRKVQPIDMFPQTYHVETVVVMSRVGK